ncbi:MAG: acyltransferase family protein [Acetatifactor sp.]|nr:acyltransferase family protein [Acetatifactor sp.]
MTTQTAGRITWIDGLKGIACLLIFTHHFALEYFNGAYFGPEAESRLPFGIDVRLSYEPYGMLLNGNFWVCVFITLAAFLTAFSVLRYCDGNWQEKISGMIIKRYIRLVIPCGAAGVLYWVLRQYLAPSFACYNDLENQLTFVRLLWHALVKMWIVTDSEVLGPYWMMYIIFWGTFIAIVLSLAARYSKKWVLPFFFLAASFFLWIKDDYYLCIVLGVLLAYLVRKGLPVENRRVRWLGLIPLAAGLYLGGYPSYARPVFFYRYLEKIGTHVLAGRSIFFYHILAAGLLILGIVLCVPMQKALSARPLRWLGSISMSVFVLHIIVLQFVGRPLRVLLLGTDMSYPLAVLFIYLFLLAALLLLAWGYKNTVERLCDKILLWF